MKNRTDCIAVKLVKDEPRVDSRIIADQLGVQHKNLLATLDNYKSDFEELGQCAFETRSGEKRPHGGTGRPVKFGLLNEDQAYLLLTYSRNTKRVRQLKINLVKAFRQAREGQQINQDYLPFHHQLHAEVQTVAKRALASGSNTPEQIHHINYARMINTALGIESGQRAGLCAQQRALVTACNVVVFNTLRDALAQGLDHKATYQMVKEKVIAFAESSGLNSADHSPARNRLAMVDLPADRQIQARGYA